MQDKPVVVIDFAGNLIRIHKKTILSIGSPECILLIINPEKLVFGIVGCSKNVRGSHRIRFSKRHCCELYSKSLVNAIKRIFPYREKETSYRLSGNLYRDGAAFFHLSESVPIKSDEVNIE